MRHPRKSDTVRRALSTPRKQSHTAPTLYDTLEVIRTASPETIHAAYRSLISRYHPDKVSGLGSELQAIANARTKEINYAYDVLGDAVRRASYDKELREANHDEELRGSEDQSFGGRDSAAAQSTWAPPPEVRGASRGHLRATLFAALAAIAALLTLTLAANLILSIVNLVVTGRDGYFQGVNSIDTNLRFSGLPYLLVMWVWLFANYVFGLVSYRLGVRVGQRSASGFDEPFAGTNGRLLLFLTLVSVIAGSELLFSAHTMPEILADMFILGGAYTAERAITWT
jgi:hypothetical protein